MLSPKSIFKACSKTSIMILLLFTAINLSAQSSKMDSCKTSVEKTKTEKLPEVNKNKKGKAKCCKKKAQKKKAHKKRMEEGFLYKNCSLSKL